MNNQHDIHFDDTEDPLGKDSGFRALPFIDDWGFSFRFHHQ